MLANGILAVGVFAVVIIFLYISFRFKKGENITKEFDQSFNIEIGRELSGDSISIYINDSLIVSGKMPDSISTFNVKRFDNDNVLMVVDEKSDKTTPFNISEEKLNILINKRGKDIIISKKLF